MPGLRAQSGQKSAVSYQWSQDSGQKSAVSSQCSQDSGQKSAVSYQWSQGSGQKSAVSSQWSTAEPNGDRERPSGGPVRTGCFGTGAARSRLHSGHERR